MKNRIYRSIWCGWEKLFHIAFRLKEISPDQEYLFYYAKRRYLGRRFEVDGITVKPFDKVIELHINNDRISEILSSDKDMMPIVLRLLKEAHRSFPALAELVSRPEFDDAVALYGITFIHRGISRLGFSNYPMRPGFPKWITKWHLRNVFRMVNPHADEILSNHAQVFEPKIVAVSRQHFVALHGIQSKSNSASAPVADQCLT
ncbi:YkoP family protein [Alicyclobacillus tolerans]|uniref:YkoP-like domain-containing protein n=1 Tax=Alicyclobacillus tolerans TaxID=90970 RepID=A0ABT9LT41_9BACL|nr:polysaccharide deacetylase [Alicyclobacillus tengchongensis]MDP9727437.1 hypothetical protein [Alicyclobacillus tengchongensis]